MVLELKNIEKSFGKKQVLTPSKQDDSDYSVEEIKERYISSEQQKRLSDSHSNENSD
ncbi:MAG: hypothetical protein LUH57_07360 [Ruminococcus sp.]|nr:hypothetical protein [Ruminococcus sp.]